MAQTALSAFSATGFNSQKYFYSYSRVLDLLSFSIIEQVGQQGLSAQAWGWVSLGFNLKYFLSWDKTVTVCNAFYTK